MKELTYSEFIDLAQQNYCRGGDSVVECWDEQAFNEYVEMFGPITEKHAYSIFRMYSSTGW